MTATWTKTLALAAMAILRRLAVRRWSARATSRAEASLSPSILLAAVSLFAAMGMDDVGHCATSGRKSTVDPKARPQ
jgi:hypothetical protein